MARQSVGKGVMLEAARKRQPSRVTGIDVQVGKHLVHAAVLGVEHLGNLFRAERCEDAARPLGEARLDLERRAIAGVPMSVAQTGERFVQGVPGGPEPIEIERRRANLAARERRERLAPSLECAQIAIALLALHRGELANEVVCALLEAGIASGGIHRAHRREIVPGDVTGEIAPRTIPPAVGPTLWGKTGARAIKSQHPIGLELEQILDVGQLRALKGAAGEPHLVQWDGLGDDTSADTRRAPRPAWRAT